MNTKVFCSITKTISDFSVQYKKVLRVERNVLKYVHAISNDSTSIFRSIDLLFFSRAQLIKPYHNPKRT